MKRKTRETPGAITRTIFLRVEGRPPLPTVHVKGRLWAECLGALLKWVRREVLAQILQCLGILPAAATDLVFLQSKDSSPVCPGDPMTILRHQTQAGVPVWAQSNFILDLLCS